MSAFHVFLFCLFCLMLGNGIFKLEASHIVYKHLENLEPQSPNQTYRTSYHFQPPKNWMNDPNGPMIYKGLYHFFYQYNPRGADWGNIVWAHSTSNDLVNWTPHEPAIYPSQLQADINGCWSGSATILPGNKPTLLYTGIDPQNRQVQNLAIPKNLSDPFLTEWVKSPHNPLMEPTSMNQINASSFRDPTTAWLGPDGLWRTIVGSKIDRKGLSILFKSKDFINWNESEHPLHSAENTGMWECPDFFPVSSISQIGLDTSRFGVGIKHVHKVSLDDTRYEYYTIGNYNPYKDIYIPDKGSVESDSGLRYDYGKFYASKTFYDSLKKRRILWGWINESLLQEDYIKQGWSGIQAIPRLVWLDKSGKQLIQWPIPEIETLRADKVQWPNTLIKGGSHIEITGVKAAQSDVDISFRISGYEEAELLDGSWSTNPQLLCSQKDATIEGGIGPFGIKVLASKDLQEYTAIFFRIFRRPHNKYVVLMCSDQSRSSLNERTDKANYGAFVDINPLYEPLSLRSLIDNSIVESFGANGKVCITSRVYPTMAIGDEAHLYVFNNGRESVFASKLSGWSMRKAHLNVQGKMIL